jgi:hypothetical protein
MTRAQFDTWLRGTRLVTLEQGSAVLAVPTTFAKELLESQYRARIEAALASVTGRAFSLRVVVSSQQDITTSQPDAAEPAVSVRARVASRPLPATHERQTNGRSQRRTEDESVNDTAHSYERPSLFDGASSSARGDADSSDAGQSGDSAASVATSRRLDHTETEPHSAVTPTEIASGRARAGAHNSADIPEGWHPAGSGERSTRMSTSAERGLPGDDGERP